MNNEHNWLKQAEIEIEKPEDSEGLAEEFYLKKAKVLALISIAKSLEDILDKLPNRLKT